MKLTEELFLMNKQRKVKEARKIIVSYLLYYLDVCLIDSIHLLQKTLHFVCRY